MNDYSNWFREAMMQNDYQDEFDLATDCCSVHELWETDYSIPQDLIEQAKKFF